jgi:hypothetical protein
MKHFIQALFLVGVVLIIGCNSEPSLQDNVQTDGEIALTGEQLSSLVNLSGESPERVLEELTIISEENHLDAEKMARSLDRSLEISCHQTCAISEKGGS